MSPLKGVELAFLTVALALAAFMQVLDTSIANVSIPYIAGDLGVSNNQGTWVITSFAVGNAISLPLTGWLTTRFGSVRIMALSIFLFTVLSWLCGGALNFDMLVICRFFQGLAAGPLIPLSQSILLQNYPTERRNFALSIFLIVVVVGPIVGPVLGGWITEDYTWNWIFYINIPVGAIATPIVWFIMRNRETKVSKVRTDWVAIILLFAGIGCLQVMLDKGEQYDWFSSPFICQLGIISLLGVSFLIVWELYQEDPLIDLSVFKIPNFGIGTFVTSVGYMCVFGAIIITPLWLQTQMGYTAFWAGLAICPMGILPFILGLILPKIMKAFPLKYLIIFAFAMFAVTFYIFSCFDTDINLGKIAASRFLLGLPITFFFTPLIALSHSEVPENKLSSASGIFHFCRIFSGGAATSLFVYLWDRRAIYHHQVLIESVTPFNPNAKKIFGIMHHMGIDNEKALEVLNVITDEQAYMQGTNDIFLFTTACSIGLMILVCFMKRRKSTSSAKTMVSD